MLRTIIFLIKLIFNICLVFIVNANENQTDCSLYDPAKVYEYTSSWMGNDQYHYFENCGSETDFYAIGEPYWIKEFKDQDWLYKNSEFDYIGDEEGDNKKDYRLWKEKPFTTNSWSTSDLGLGFYYCDTQKKHADFDGDGIGDIYVSKYYGGTSNSRESAFLSVGKKEVIGYHDSSGELGSIWCDVNQNGIAEFRRVGERNNPTQVFVEYDPNQKKFVEVTLRPDLTEKFKLAHQSSLEVKTKRINFYSNQNDFPEWIEKWKEITFETYEKCSEIEPFNEKEFLVKNKINIPKSYDPFFYWYLAEDAANKKFAGEYDNKLILQLICMGGGSPAAMETAFENTYKLWMFNKPMHFNLCEVVTSGVGGSICAGRRKEKFETENNQTFEAFIDKTDYIIYQSIEDAKERADKFFDLKATHEEGHYGTGYAGWVFSSIMDHQKKYTDRIAMLISGNKDFYKKYDLETKTIILEVMFQTVSDNIQEKTIQSHLPSISGLKLTLDQFYEVQRLWLDYYETTSNMFHKIDPIVDIDEWKAFLIDERINDLAYILN